MARAKELLDLVKSPTAVATVVLIGFAQKALTANKEKYSRKRTWPALFAAIGAAIISCAIVAIMTPLALTSLANDGDVETRLLVYWLTFLVAVGTAVYCVISVRDTLVSGDDKSIWHHLSPLEANDPNA